MCLLVGSWWHLSVPLPMMAIATRCWLHVVTRANRCDQKLILPRGIFCLSPTPFHKHMFLIPMMAFATRCWLHVVARANRCDQKLILPIPVPKVSCHLANKMSTKVWRTSCLDQYDTTCCGHVLAMKIQHCYRGVDSVDSRWTRGGLSLDTPPNPETIW